MRKVALADIGGRGSFAASPRYNPESVQERAADPVAEAFQAGLAEGRRIAEAAALAAHEAEAADGAAIELAFAHFDADSARLLQERLRTTVAAICQAMAGDVAIDTDRLATRVETAAAMLRRSHDERVIRLHPADLALIRDRVDPALSLKADPVLERGALRVESENGGVEDGAEQWRLALAEALTTCSH